MSWNSAGLGFRGAGHAGQLLVEAEIILDRDRRERLRLVLDLDPFLGFDGLVQAIAPAAAGHQAAGVLVDDDDLVVLDDVLHVLLVEAVGPEQLGNGVDPLGLGSSPLLQLVFASTFSASAQRRVVLDLGEGRWPGPAARTRRDRSG